MYPSNLCRPLYAVKNRRKKKQTKLFAKKNFIAKKTKY